MYIKVHGGKCCGIKVIHGFPARSTDACYPLTKVDNFVAQDLSPGMTDIRTPFFYEAAPQETAIDRLDRFLRFLRNYRRKGLVEIVLTNGQLPHWQAIIEERGFKLVTSFMNSNSQNTCNVFHLVMDGTTPAEEDDAEED